MGVEVVVRAGMGESTLGERGGQQKEAEGPHRGGEGEGGRKKGLTGFNRVVIRRGGVMRRACRGGEDYL